MTKRLLTHLRHVDLAIPDYDRQLDFYSGIWGLTPVEKDNGLAFLAAEGSPEQYIVRLRRAEEKRLDLIAFGAASAQDVDEQAENLLRDGVALISRPDALDTPGAGYGFRFFDNDGRTVEVSADVASREHRRIEEKESIPVRLSHVVLNSVEPANTRAWYEKHLGFSLSDQLCVPGGPEIMNFMRVNENHHSVAFARGPHTAVHHVSFELRGLDEFMRGTGRMLQAGHRMLWGPGRHVAGDNAYSYWSDPQGNTIEYTTALEIVDEDTWHPTMYDATTGDSDDQWGTANPIDEYMAGLSVNEKDNGVFTPPPV